METFQLKKLHFSPLSPLSPPPPPSFRQLSKNLIQFVEHSIQECSLKAKGEVGDSSGLYIFPVAFGFT